mmetsp:Transcript_39843/g.119870  ORF Transcript_39843/g.119870 Transcript_39843/m.119870 type:complete len:102 (-) Transcript_39843:1136-1441(-)
MSGMRWADSSDEESDEEEQVYEEAVGLNDGSIPAFSQVRNPVTDVRTRPVPGYQFPAVHGRQKLGDEFVCQHGASPDPVPSSAVGDWIGGGSATHNALRRK